jgi:hypothetical protein
VGASREDVAVATSAEKQLADAADELYALVPGEFTAARNASAKAAKTAGDRSFADELSRLQKPSAAAWGVNMLVRHRSAEIDQLLELGGAMRAAQEDLDSAALRSLGTQRRAVIGAVAKQARILARELGSPLGDPAVEEIEHTLQAAMADADAAAAVRTGRLVRGLTTVGFEPVDLSGAVAVPGNLSGATARPSPAKGVKQPARLDDARRKKRIAEAQADLDAARRKTTEAEEDVSAAEERIREATASREQLERERQELEARLEALADELVAASKRLRELARTKENAEDARDQAERAADRAERRVVEAESS